MVLTLGLEALFAQGARQAGPGEFTRRAFLNGRLDLTQAEAVGDLLEASSREGARHAAGQLSGALSQRIGAIYSALVDMMAHFHAVLDYPDEDIDPFTQDRLAGELAEQEGALERLTATYRRGRQLNRGIKCALVGRPNAGKSSLLNALVGYERAIVTDIPGTTRDTVEETVELGGVPLRLIDTAGLRDSGDPIEQLGVARSRAAMEEAELILVLWDQLRPGPRGGRGAAGQSHVPGSHHPGVDQGGPALRAHSLSESGPHASGGGAERQDGRGAGGPVPGGGRRLFPREPAPPTASC